MTKCMYCGISTSNKNHVCKKCNESAKKLHEKRKRLIAEGEKEQARRAFYED